MEILKVKQELEDITFYLECCKELVYTIHCAMENGHFAPEDHLNTLYLTYVNLSAVHEALEAYGEEQNK